MTIYSEIAKEIDFLKDPDEPIPPGDIVTDLVHDALMGEKDAFRQLFRIKRLARANGPDDYAKLAVIDRAWTQIIMIYTAR